MVYALALSLVREADADDVAQEAFLTAFRNLDLLADPAKFGVWLRRITFGVAIDHVRAERARSARVVESREMAGTGTHSTATEPTDPAPSPLHRLQQTEVADRVLSALDRMPARYRVPLSLYHIDGLTHAKVAHTLGVPESTVRSLVARARRKLARLLADAPEARDMTDEHTEHRSLLRRSADVLDDSVTTPRFLHVLNGDSVRVTLEQSDVPGAFAVYAEILHEGPVPRATGTHAWRDVRARYLGARGYIPYGDALRNLEQWDAKLEAYPQYDEVVLWFEHDLFDQLLLVRHLDWFARQDLGRTALSLICIGEFPGFERFDGLGQLNADQLASLLGTRQPVSSEQLSLGKEAWGAFTASDPTALDALARVDHDVLPFLGGALQRIVEEYPATDTGLPRTESEILDLLVQGASSPAKLFVAKARREERVYMGDSTFWLRVQDLAGGETPLVSLDVGEVEDDGVLPDGTVTITDAGRAVLAGRADWIDLDGFDRWIGGVHLTATLGGDTAWRYDSRLGRLIRR
jgi:RNA polymerase sigma factor (sigma-70 family)